MATYSCPDCQEQVSELARFCPNCGRQLVAESQEPPVKQGSNTAMIIVVVLLGLCLLGSVLSFVLSKPAISRGKLSAMKANTLSNFKQVGLALLMYQGDYDDQYPPQFQTNADLQFFTMPYAKAVDLYKTLNPNGGEMMPNPKLEGIDSNKIVQLADTVMLEETKEWPDGSRIIAFTDSHAKPVPKSGQPGLIYNPLIGPP